MPVSPQDSNAEVVRQPRRRHVVSRDRNGCFTCRRRHLRCDKAKPHCNSCLTANINCEGYGNKIAFKDQTSFVTQRFSGRDDAPKKRRHQPSQEVISAKPASPQVGPMTRSGPEYPEFFIDEYTSGMVQPAHTTMLSSPVMEDSFWPDWALADVLRTDGRQLQMFGASPSLQELGCSPAESILFSSLNVGLLDNQLICPRLSPSPLTLANPINKTFLFPEDADYYRQLLEGQVKGLTTILPIRDLIVEEGLSTPYLYSAALAISALTFSWGDTQSVARRHALRHYTMSLNSLREAFPENNPKSFQNTSLNELLSWFLTRLLLANFDLSWGSLSAWRAHLRAAGKVLSAWHGRFSRSAAGRKLAHAFARMALLVELQNEEHAVTRLRTMNPAIADELSAMLERSDTPRDRLLHLIREVTQLEVRCRSQPGLDTKCALQMGSLEVQLAAWQRSLPASELPVDTGVQDPIAFTSAAADYLACMPVLSTNGSGLHITPLTFPSSTDPYTAAVNYAHFLCARMRARTRYVEGTGRVTPPDTETTVLHICRIAAGVAPTGCAQADAFGHGMMPAVFGAYRWTTNPQIQAWIEGWLRGYPNREGIWNVCQTRRLLTWLEAERARRRKTERGWDIIAARIEDEDDDDGEDDRGCGGSRAEKEDRVWDQVARRGSDSESSCGSLDDMRVGRSGINAASGDTTGPFRVIVHSKMSGSWTTDYFVVP